MKLFCLPDGEISADSATLGHWSFIRFTSVGNRCRRRPSWLGANLQDHVRVPIIFRVERQPYSSLPNLVMAGARYVARRRGLLTSNVADAGAILRSDEDADVRTFES